MILTGMMYGTAHAAAPALVRAGRPAPAFTLTDTNNKSHSLAEWRGRTAALFFFCGCEPCHRFASLWSQAQESGAGPAGSKPVTIVVFSGEAAEARAFASQTHLGGTDTILLLDTQERTADRYGVMVCPRVFALDPQGVIRYTNDEPGSNPQKTPAVSLVSRMLTALTPAPGKPGMIKPKGKRAVDAR